MKVFFDCEFTSLAEQPKLISIGMITEDSCNTFYAELSDTYRSSDLSQFASEYVIPLLDGSSKSFTQLSLDLHNWIVDIDEEIELATDNPTWDWPFILDILESNWPSNLSRHCYLLNLNYLNDADAFFNAVKFAYENSLRKHHALDDARANRLGWIASENVKY